MKMRKFLAIMLTLVMVASMLCTSALAAGEPTFKGDKIEAKAGDTITYNVYIENNPGIAGFKVQVDFSDAAFDLTSKDEDEFENTIDIKMGDFSLNSDTFGNLVSNTTAYGCVALWFNVENVDDDGIAFKVILKVADDAINGEHAVKIRCDAINTLDKNGNLVAFKTIDGTVTVSGGVDGVINNDEVGPSPEELQQMEEGTLSENGNPIVKGETIVVDDNNGTDGTDGVDSADKLHVDDENAGEDGDSPDGNKNSDAEGMNLVTMILIIVAAIVAIAVVALVIVKAKSKKSSDNIGAIPGSDDREMEIEEVMGWDDADEDEDDED